MKNFFISTIGIIIFLLVLSMGINYYLNPYGVFFREYKNYLTSSPINERYIKTKYVLDNPQKYDSFIFGSSRVGTLEGENLKKIGSFYNMSFSGAVPKQILEILEIFIENGLEIKNIILGIDDFDFYLKPEDSEFIPYKISYLNLNNNYINFFKYYLLKNPLNFVNKEYIFGKIKTKRDILESGKWISEDKDRIIESDLDAHKLKLSKIRLHFSLNNRVSETIQEIERIANLCRENKINLTVIYLPLYKETYLVNQKLIEKSKKELLKVTSFWDFARLDKYTTDEYYWYEESHYRPMLGRKIFKRIYRERFTKNVEYDENFGIYKNK